MAVNSIIFSFELQNNRIALKEKTGVRGGGGESLWVSRSGLNEGREKGNGLKDEEFWGGGGVYLHVQIRNARIWLSIFRSGRIWVLLVRIRLLAVWIRLPFLICILPAF